MSESLKCPCAACGTNIEFPKEYLGEQVACPSCDTQTVLALAVIKPRPTPPPPPRPAPAPPPLQHSAEGSFLEIKSFSCLNCGSRLPVQKGTHEMKCDYCGTEGIRIIRPIAVADQPKREGVSNDDQQRFRNLVAVLKKSMLAGSYKEAYDYCNKALEIDPESASIWENKAICAYWMAMSDDIIDEAEAREIATYLDTASDLDPDSATLKKTREDIAYMIYALAHRWMCETKPDLFDSSSSGYSSPLIETGIFRYIKLYEVSFSISNEIGFLKEAVRELTDGMGSKGLSWSRCEQQVPTARTRNVYIAKIKKLDPSYDPPVPKRQSGCFIATAAMGAYDDPSVILLSRFRDTMLLPNSFGRTFVRFYYAVSPPVALWMQNKGRVCKAVKYFLILPAGRVAGAILRREHRINTP